MTHIKTILCTAMNLLEEGEEYAGVCTDCGAVSYEVEPDACEYPCDECEANKVYGAEQIVVMFGI